MTKKEKRFRDIGIILVVFQVISYTQLDFDSLLAPNNTVYSDLSYVLSKIIFLIGYSMVGLIGLGLLIAYKKKTDNNKNGKTKELKNDYISQKKCNECGTVYSATLKECPKCNDMKNKLVCDNCGAIVDKSAKKCPHCDEIFDDEETKNDKKDIEITSKKSMKSGVDQKYSDLNKLKELLDNDVITKEEFEKEKKKILNKNE